MKPLLNILQLPLGLIAAFGFFPTSLSAQSGSQVDPPGQTADSKSLSLALKDYKVDYKVGQDGSLHYRMTSADGSREFPVSGTACSGNHGHPAGQKATAPELVYVAHLIKQESSNVRHVVFTMRGAVITELHIRSYFDESIVEQWTVFRNEAKHKVMVPRIDSAGFQIPAAKGVWLESFGSTSGSEAGSPILAKLTRGSKVLESGHGNRHVSGTQPFFTLGFGSAPDEETVPCLVASLNWSGSTRLSFNLDDSNLLEVSCGVNPSQEVPISPGESITTPVLVSTFSSAGKGPASRNFHHWVRRYGMRDGGRPRLVDNNSWEGCRMEVSEASIIEMMRLSAELGIELYVMDDGWFGNGDQARVTDHAGLGDWQPNKIRFPNGLAPLLRAAEEHNIAFGIWFEPEMINPRSNLFQKHPEWVMRVPGSELKLERNQAVLDMANPAVQEFVYHAVADVLTAHPAIRFVKWDANSSIRNPYSPFLGPDRQGQMLIRYMEGYYGVMDRLVRAFPKVDFQACSGGGGRADLGALKYSHTFWPSDNTNPGYRLGAVWNFTLIMPPIAPTSHVTHAGGFKPKYRFDVSMMGQLGMEVDPRKSDPDYLAAAKVGIAAYKEVRDIVQFGEQYRHGSPFNSSVPAVTHVSPDQTRALLLAYQTCDIRTPLSITSPVSGLAPALRYRLREINLPPGDDKPRLSLSAPKTMTGAEWMKGGVPLIFTRGHDSAAIVLETASQECVLTAEDARITGGGARFRDGMISDWDDVGTSVFWDTEIEAGEFEVFVLQAAEATPGANEYRVEIADATLKGVVKDTGGWLKPEQVSLGKVSIERAGPIHVVLRPVKKGERGLMNIASVMLRRTSQSGSR